MRMVLGAVVALSTLVMRPDQALSQAGPSLAVVNARVWTADTRIIDARGMMLVPGFIDTHVHFLSGGFGLASVQLRDARTPAEFVARIKAYAARLPPGAWITEGNWDHEQWGGELPRRDWIDSVTPNNPVWINRLDGHMNLGNSLALRAAGITRQTADVPGGTIVRGPDGEPTGVLKDNATALV